MLFKVCFHSIMIFECFTVCSAAVLAVRNAEDQIGDLNDDSKYQPEYSN